MAYMPLYCTVHHIVNSFCLATEILNVISPIGYTHSFTKSLMRPCTHTHTDVLACSLLPYGQSRPVQAEDKKTKTKVAQRSPGEPRGWLGESNDHDFRKPIHLRRGAGRPRVPLSCEQPMDGSDTDVVRDRWAMRCPLARTPP